MPAPTIQSIRAQYPQYNDMSDAQLASSLHTKFYSDMPQNQFYQKINFNPPVSTPAATSTIQTMANSPLVNSVLGAGDAVRNTLSDAANLIPGVNIPAAKTGSGLAYNIGDIAGNIGAFLGGGEVLDTARAAAEGVPYLGKLAQSLAGNNFASGLAKRAIGTAGYGAITNPNDRAVGAAEGAGLSGLADTMPLIAQGLAKASQAVRPASYAQQIIDGLSGGKSLEDNAKSLASNIKNAFDQRAEEGSALYNPIFDSLGNSSIYDSVNPSSGSYQSLDNDILGSYDRNLNKLHQQFTVDPSLQNAHNLQSQLGTSIRKLQTTDARGNLSVADRSTLQGYQEAQDALRTDMDSFLTSKDPSLAGQYQNATENWNTNVTPYLENSKIAPIAKGEITNPRNIATIFKNPEDNIQKIVGDLGEDAANKIIYSQLGKSKIVNDPDKLASAISGLKDQGLESYITPTLSDQLDTLNSRISNRNMLQRGSGALLGAAALHPLIHSLPVDMLAAGGAYAMSPSVMKTLQTKLPIAQFRDTLVNAARAAYPMGSKAVIANTVPGAQ